MDRWTKQYRASETQHIPEFEKLAEWLPKTIPQQERVSIVHGDYRLDNMIFHPVEPRVLAVLDWELSTLGDPMADFTYLLMQWTMPGLANADLKALNIPSMEEAAQIYCNVTGITVPDLNWYFAYNLFRLAGITQGIAGRIRDGTAANAKALESAKRTVPLSKAAWEYAQKAGGSNTSNNVIARESGRFDPQGWVERSDTHRFPPPQPGGFSVGKVADVTLFSQELCASR